MFRVLTLLAVCVHHSSGLPPPDFVIEVSNGDYPPAPVFKPIIPIDALNPISSKVVDSTAALSESSMNQLQNTLDVDLADESVSLDNVSIPPSPTDEQIVTLTIYMSNLTTEQETTGMTMLATTTEVPTTTAEQTDPFYSTAYKKTLLWLTNTYTLSILIPVAAGFVFAAVVIVIVATCSCIRRKCCKRRMRKKSLSEIIKSMNASDRAKLLAESSDEEL